MTSRCLGNGRSDATWKQYGGVSASYKQYVSDEFTYNIESRQKHNMLSLLHAACLKLLVFFFYHGTTVAPVLHPHLSSACSCIVTKGGKPVSLSKCGFCPEFGGHSRQKITLIVTADEMHCCSNLFWQRTVHASDRSTVHHQESQHYIHSNRYLSY